MNSQMRLTEDIYLVGSAEFGISMHMTVMFI